MGVGLLCCAVAVLVLPVSGGQRRFGRLFGVAQRGRLPRVPVEWCVGILVGCAAFGFGVGTGLAALILGVTVAVRNRRGRAERERRQECAHLLAGLEAVVGELRVGAHPSAAAESAAGESRGEAARVLAISAGRSRLGGSGADGLVHPDSVVAEELSRIATAWRVAEQHGLALAELLSAARTDLLARTRFRDRTESALAGARASATVLAGLPLVGVGLGQLMGAAPLSVLFASPAGEFLLPLGTALACCGLLWTDVITRRGTA
ncbi:type ii secretion system integral membrane subunit [Nocardia coubleae]|uniref:Type ii secretion system integral membrane subunit n=1 Tax=Nocardia coubleae TaxID=356147 RepID=A0A846W770_9NOCA|nr:type II secretion system F family protein [Nocardia coubleae]NKX89182.1 type ii secretion system integral membrane subunit [Nocardia coubleae]